MLAHFAPSHLRGRAFGFHRAMDHAGAVRRTVDRVGVPLLLPGPVPDALRPDASSPASSSSLILLRVPGHAASLARTSRRRLNPLNPVDLLNPLNLEKHAALPLSTARSLVIFLFSLGNASDAFLLLRMSDLGVAAFWIPLSGRRCTWSRSSRRSLAATCRIARPASTHCGRLDHLRHRLRRLRLLRIGGGRRSASSSFTVSTSGSRKV